MTGISGLSLFSGAGGMDVGFKRAGVNIVAANELEKNAALTFSENHPDTQMLEGDISSLMKEMSSFKGVDLVFGGPPCQGFSVAGKMNPNDERSKLIWKFLDVVSMVDPEIFIMENVKSLATLEKWSAVRQRFFERANDLGYHCNHFVLNSSNYGVSQNRERVFFVGSKTPYRKASIEESLQKLEAPSATLRDLFSNLPKYGSEYNPITCSAKITLASKPVLRKSPYAGMLFNGMGRPLNLDSVSYTLPASMGGNKTPIVDSTLIDNPNGFDWVKDYHSKIKNGIIVPAFAEAPGTLRRITTLEAASIQSFPEDYTFLGPKTSIYSQIGNAVPCRLAEVIAKSVLDVCISTGIDFTTSTESPTFQESLFKV